MFNPSDAICASLAERIEDLQKFGLCNIWMKGTGKCDRYHITYVMGIDRDD